MSHNEPNSNGINNSALRFMAIFAHPDDEVFGCGGVMLLNKQRGIHNTLICATKGEAGEISSPDLATPANLGVVREQELRTAAQHMGVDELFFLGYRDSGMAGTEANKSQGAFVNASASAVVPRLVRFLRLKRPHVVLTFDPTGGYGHPDHIAIHQHTVAAFHAAADPAYDPALGEPWQVQRLYYPAFRREIFVELTEQLVAMGIEPPDWNPEDDMVAEQPIHASIDVSPVVAQKWLAFKSHRTQFGTNHPFLVVPEAFILRMLGTESFEQAWPANPPQEPVSDLYAGIAA